MANYHVVKVLELHHEVVGSTSLHSLGHAQLYGNPKETCTMDSNDWVEEHYYAHGPRDRFINPFQRVCCTPEGG